MFEMIVKSVKVAPKNVFLVPCFVVLAACSSKQITNASLEPIDLPADEETSSYNTPTPEPEYAGTESFGSDTYGTTDTFAPAITSTPKKFKKSSKKKSSNVAKWKKKKKTAIASNKKKKKSLGTSVASVKNTGDTGFNGGNGSAAIATAPAFEETARIGDATIPTEPIAMPEIAPPIPMDMTATPESKPNWLFIGVGMASVVLLIGVAFRIRRQQTQKRGLVFN